MKPCRICGRPDNRIQIRAGSGICCNICEGIAKGKLDTKERRNRAIDYLWSINTTDALQTLNEIGSVKDA